MLKLKVQIPWPPDAKTQHIRKDPDAGKNKLGKRRKVQERMKWKASPTQVGANKFDQTQGETEGLGSMV